ncbi:hypothetical protein OEZ86_003873 [Tetradesmus obliquus]|nr:hypothetical protein OEZ86_003873 [Tetradesmus obliquus]
MEAVQVVCPSGLFPLPARCNIHGPSLSASGAVQSSRDAQAAAAADNQHQLLEQLQGYCDRANTLLALISVQRAQGSACHGTELQELMDDASACIQQALQQAAAAKQPLLLTSSQHTSCFCHLLEQLHLLDVLSASVAAEDQAQQQRTEQQQQQDEQRQWYKVPRLPAQLAGTFLSRLEQQLQAVPGIDAALAPLVIDSRAETIAAGKPELLNTKSLERCLAVLAAKPVVPGYADMHVSLTSELETCQPLQELLATRKLKLLPAAPWQLDGKSAAKLNQSYSLQPKVLPLLQQHDELCDLLSQLALEVKQAVAVDRDIEVKAFSDAEKLVDGSITFVHAAKNALLELDAWRLSHGGGAKQWKRPQQHHDADGTAMQSCDRFALHDEDVVPFMDVLGATKGLTGLLTDSSSWLEQLLQVQTIKQLHEFAASTLPALAKLYPRNTLVQSLLKSIYASMQGQLVELKDDTYAPSYATSAAGDVPAAVLTPTGADGQQRQRSLQRQSEAEAEVAASEEAAAAAAAAAAKAMQDSSSGCGSSHSSGLGLSEPREQQSSSRSALQLGLKGLQLQIGDEESSFSRAGEEGIDTSGFSSMCSLSMAFQRPPDLPWEVSPQEGAAAAAAASSAGDGTSGNSPRSVAAAAAQFESRIAQQTSRRSSRLSSNQAVVGVGAATPLPASPRLLAGEELDMVDGTEFELAEASSDGALGPVPSSPRSARRFHFFKFRSILQHHEKLSTQALADAAAAAAALEAAAAKEGDGEAAASGTSARIRAVLSMRRRTAAASAVSAAGAAADGADAADAEEAAAHAADLASGPAAAGEAGAASGSALPGASPRGSQVGEAYDAADVPASTHGAADVADQPSKQGRIGGLMSRAASRMMSLSSRASREPAAAAARGAGASSSQQARQGFKGLNFTAKLKKAMVDRRGPAEVAIDGIVLPTLQLDAVPPLACLLQLRVLLEQLMHEIKTETKKHLMIQLQMAAAAAAGGSSAKPDASIARPGLQLLRQQEEACMCCYVQHLVPAAYEHFKRIAAHQTVTSEVLNSCGARSLQPVQPLYFDALLREPCPVVLQGDYAAVTRAAEGQLAQPGAFLKKDAAAVVARARVSSPSAVVEVQLQAAILQRTHQLVSQYAPLPCSWPQLWERADAADVADSVCDSACAQAIAGGVLAMLNTAVYDSEARVLLPAAADAATAAAGLPAAGVLGEVSAALRPLGSFFGRQHLQALLGLAGPAGQAHLLEGLMDKLDEEQGCLLDQLQVMQQQLPPALLQLPPAERYHSAGTVLQFYQQQLSSALSDPDGSCSAALACLQRIGNCLALLHLLTMQQSVQATPAFMQVAPLLGIIGRPLSDAAAAAECFEYEGAADPPTVQTAGGFASRSCAAGLLMPEVEQLLPSESARHAHEMQTQKEMQQEQAWRQLAAQHGQPFDESLLKPGGQLARHRIWQASHFQRLLLGPDAEKVRGSALLLTQTAELRAWRAAQAQECMGPFMERLRRWAGVLQRQLQGLAGEACESEEEAVVQLATPGVQCSGDAATAAAAGQQQYLGSLAGNLPVDDDVRASLAGEVAAGAVAGIGVRENTLYGAAMTPPESPYKEQQEHMAALNQQRDDDAADCSAQADDAAQQQQQRGASSGSQRGVSSRQVLLQVAEGQQEQQAAADAREAEKAKQQRSAGMAAGSGRSSRCHSPSGLQRSSLPGTLEDAADSEDDTATGSSRTASSRATGSNRSQFSGASSCPTSSRRHGEEPNQQQQQQQAGSSSSEADEASKTGRAEVEADGSYPAPNVNDLLFESTCCELVRVKDENDVLRSELEMLKNQLQNRDTSLALLSGNLFTPRPSERGSTEQRPPTVPEEGMLSARSRTITPRGTQLSSEAAAGQAPAVAVAAAGSSTADQQRVESADGSADVTVSSGGGTEAAKVPEVPVACASAAAAASPGTAGAAAAMLQPRGLGLSAGLIKGPAGLGLSPEPSDLRIESSKISMRAQQPSPLPPTLSTCGQARKHALLDATSRIAHWVEYDAVKVSGAAGADSTAEAGAASGGGAAAGAAGDGSGAATPQLPGGLQTPGGISASAASSIALPKPRSKKRQEEEAEEEAQMRKQQAVEQLLLQRLAAAARQADRVAKDGASLAERFAPVAPAHNQHVQVKVHRVDKAALLAQREASAAGANPNVNAPNAAAAELGRSSRFSSMAGAGASAGFSQPGTPPAQEYAVLAVPVQQELLQFAPHVRPWAGLTPSHWPIQSHPSLPMQRPRPLLLPAAGGKAGAARAGVAAGAGGVVGPAGRLLPGVGVGANAGLVAAARAVHAREALLATMPRTAVYSFSVMSDHNRSGRMDDGYSKAPSTADLDNLEDISPRKAGRHTSAAAAAAAARLGGMGAAGVADQSGGYSASEASSPSKSPTRSPSKRQQAVAHAGGLLASLVG